MCSLSMCETPFKVWMLTGDKFETAFNIGLATCLVPSTSQHIYIVPDRIFGERTPEDDKGKIEYLKDILPLILRTIKDDPQHSQASPTPAGTSTTARRTDCNSTLWVCLLYWVHMFAMLVILVVNFCSSCCRACGYPETNGIRAGQRHRGFQCDS